MKKASFLRAAPLHFLLLGALLHGAQALWPTRSAVTIAATDEDRARLRREWRAETGRWPSAPELQASEQRFLDDELLLAEALRLGLDQRDPVARARLLQNLRFAFPDRAPGSEADDLAEARALGMAASDLVVRRRLIQRMEQRLLGEVAIDEAELRRYVAGRPARYGGLAGLRTQQVYFSRDVAGRDGAAQARAMRVRLESEPALAVEALGDPFLLGESPVASVEALGRRYGPAFAQAVAAAPLGRWIGPLETVYGWHLLRVEHRQPATAPDFEALRARAAYAWLAEQEPRLLHQRLAPLRRRYGLVEPASP